MRYLLALLFITAFLVPSLGHGQGFLVLEELFFTNQPDSATFASYGIKEIYCAYQYDFGGYGPAQESMTRSASRKAANGRSYRNILPLDQEYWTADYRYVGLTEARAAVAKLCENLRWFKNESPALKAGFYGQIPNLDYSSYLDATDLAGWRDANNLLQPLADSVDFVSPDLYALWKDTAQYAGYAKANIAEARRLAKGKPVFGWISPQFHPAGDWYGQFVDSAYMRKILETAKAGGADGIILWGGDRAMDASIHVWDETQGWWKATKAFMASLRTGAPFVGAPDLRIPAKGSASTATGFVARWVKENGASRYHVQIATNITFQNPVLNDSTLTDTVRQVGPLLPKTKYYCRVRAKGTSNWGSYSIVSDFTTDDGTLKGLPGDGTMPVDFELAQNYPNPFNPSTVIRFALPARAQVSLILYNTLGQAVRELVSGEHEAGYHEVRVDGTGLSSGLYFYRIAAGGFTATKKMMLLQ